MSAAIVPFSEALRRQTIALVDRVFPVQSPLERLGLRLYRTRWEWLLGRCGIHDARFWLAVRDGAPIGTVGLYTTTADRHEAEWLAWYCVAPEARGTGVGRLLLDHAVARARETGKPYLRLYTSTDPNEAAAQAVYERNGFVVTRVVRPLLWRPWGLELLYRERRLG